MTEGSLSILYEDNHLLAVAKPAGLATMGVAAGKPSLVTEAKGYIREKYNKPGNVYLGVVSRLDTPVTGVVIFARTSKAAARLNDQFRQGEVEKVYWALVERSPDPAQGGCVDWLRRDARHRRVHIAASSDESTQQARLQYRTLKSSRRASLIEVRLETGRKHQIRVQLSSRGWPILGDRKYKSRQSFPSGIALHARSLGVTHPVQKVRLQLVAPLPPSWREFRGLLR